MNIPFRIGGGNEKLEADFLNLALSQNMISLKGHRLFYYFFFIININLDRLVEFESLFTIQFR